MCDTVERRVSFASTRERRLLFDEKRSGAVVASAGFAVGGRFASEGEREADDAGAGAEIGDARRWRPVHASGDVRGEDERVDVASVPAARLQEEEASAEEHVQGLVGVGRHRVGRARAGAGRGIGGSVRGETALERGGLAAREEAEGAGTAEVSSCTPNSARRSAMNARRASGVMGSRLRRGPRAAGSIDEDEDEDAGAGASSRASQETASPRVGRDDTRDDTGAAVRRRATAAARMVAQGPNRGRGGRTSGDAAASMRATRELPTAHHARRRAQASLVAGRSGGA